MALNQLRAFARYQTHGGYTWAAVLSDGELICETCALDNYRDIYQATRRNDNSGWDDSGWAVIGLTNSGEWEPEEFVTCCRCGKAFQEPEQI